MRRFPPVNSEVQTFKLKPFCMEEKRATSGLSTDEVLLNFCYFKFSYIVSMNERFAGQQGWSGDIQGALNVLQRFYVKGKPPELKMLAVKTVHLHIVILRSILF